jgi:hypothetical protein
MNHSGHFLYLWITLGKNDRKVLTSSPLFLEEGEYFSVIEFTAADGAFEGEGWLGAPLKIKERMRLANCSLWVLCCCSGNFRDGHV